MIKDYIKKMLNIRNEPINEFHQIGSAKNQSEIAKTPSRNEIINALLATKNTNTSYLEIGVRNPNDNFNLIKATAKTSVDPGIEFEANPVDYKLTSDEFFERINSREVIEGPWDVIFIDGLHLAEQVKKDILNALEHLKEDGFIVLHDCNPPTEWHARETFEYNLSPAGGAWNGTTWKAFINARNINGVSICCIDTDWGVGIISKTRNFNDKKKIDNDFFEFEIFNTNRTVHLNLISWDTFKNNHLDSLK